MPKRKVLIIIFVVVVVSAAAGAGLLTVLLTSSSSSAKPDTTQNSKLNIDAICQDALAYMTFPAGTNEPEQFVADCKAGKHPEVIEKYKADNNLNGTTI